MGTHPRHDIGTRISNYSLILVAIALALALAMGLMAQNHSRDQLASDQSPDTMYVSRRMTPQWSQPDTEPASRPRFVMFIPSHEAHLPDEASASGPGRLYDAN